MEQQTSPKKSGARKREAYKMPNKCPVCGKRFKYLFCMNEHLKKSKICASQVVQPDVEEETTTQLDLTQENGQIVVIQQAQHKCASCELNFPSSTALIEHNQRCYKMEYRCNICSKRFKYEFGYNKHMDVEHGSRTGQNVAGSSAGGADSFRSNTVLGKKHNVAAISPAKKVGIGKVEKNYGKLEYKPYTMSFVCKICKKRFKEEFCLDKHMEVLHPEPGKKKPAASTVVTTSPQTVHYVQKNIAQPTVIQQPQSIQYQIIQTEDGVQMVQEIQTVQAVEAVEMPKVMLCGYCNAPFTKKHYLTEHMAQHHN